MLMVKVSQAGIKSNIASMDEQVNLAGDAKENWALCKLADVAQFGAGLVREEVFLNHHHSSMSVGLWISTQRGRVIDCTSGFYEIGRLWVTCMLHCGKL